MNVSALVTAAAQGDRASWDMLVERFTPLVWATVRGHRLADPDAGDVVQTTWLRLVEHLGRLQEPERVGAWLATTARRESLRVIAAGHRTQPHDVFDDLRDEAAGPPEVLQAGERDRLLRRALAMLSGSCRTLLRVLAADPAPSYDEISAALDMPVGSIGPTRRRCMDRLRAELESVGITSAG